MRCGGSWKRKGEGEKGRKGARIGLVAKGDEHSLAAEGDEHSLVAKGDEH